MKLYVQNNYVANLAIDGEIGNFETSVRFFTVDPGNDVCTLFATPYKENEKNRIDRIMFLAYIYSGGKL